MSERDEAKVVSFENGTFGVGLGCEVISSNMGHGDATWTVGHVNTVIRRALDDHASELAAKEARIVELTEKYQVLVKFYDQQAGTPCEQIRHRQEVERLTERNARLTTALEDLYANVMQAKELGLYHNSPSMACALQQAEAALTEPPK